MKTAHACTVRRIIGGVVNIDKSKQCVEPVGVKLIAISNLISTVLLIGVLLYSERTFGQSFLPAKEFEIEQARRELERIVATDTTEARAARQALDALNQPESSPVGRRARNRREQGDRRIVNGLPTVLYTSVGALLKGNDRGSARAWCTGTLVGCDKYLTAAHCIADNPSPGAYLVFFQQAGFFEVKEIAWNKDAYKGPYFDLAMLTLARSVEGVAPSIINDKEINIPGGFSGTIVGFGRTGGSRYDYGIKREGSIKTGRCPAQYSNSRLFCWSFHADVKPGDAASNTCFADSGGGIFMFDNDERGRVVAKVFGVVSGGRDRSCTQDDLSYNVDLGRYRQWIEGVGQGRLSAQTCGKPMATAVESRQELVRLSAAAPEIVIKIDVPPNTAALSVAMNGEDNSFGANDFDLLVRRGDQLPAAASLCDESGPGQFGYCSIESPLPGTWYVIVRRKRGEGEAQITATLVPKE
jgi:hypothetical protein